MIVESGGEKGTEHALVLRYGRHYEPYSIPDAKASSHLMMLNEWGGFEIIAPHSQVGYRSGVWRFATMRLSLQLIHDRDLGATGIFPGARLLDRGNK